jgi:hypothetical protein
LAEEYVIVTMVRVFGSQQRKNARNEKEKEKEKK